MTRRKAGQRSRSADPGGFLQALQFGRAQRGLHGLDHQRQPGQPCGEDDARPGEHQAHARRFPQQPSAPAFMAEEHQQHEAQRDGREDERKRDQKAEQTAQRGRAGT